MNELRMGGVGVCCHVESAVWFAGSSISGMETASLLHTFAIMVCEQKEEL